MRTTLPIEERVRASIRVQEMGFEVRWRVDQILTPPGWRSEYRGFFRDAARSGARPTRITLGTYRENSPSLKTTAAVWGLPSMEWIPETPEEDGMHAHLSRRERVEIYSAIFELVVETWEDRAPAVALCKEPIEVRRAVGVDHELSNCGLITELQTFCTSAPHHQWRVPLQRSQGRVLLGPQRECEAGPSGWIDRRTQHGQGYTVPWAGVCMLRLKRRGLETGSRSTLNRHEGEIPETSKGGAYGGTAPALDPTGWSQTGPCHSFRLRKALAYFLLLTTSLGAPIVEISTFTGANRNQASRSPLL